MDSVTSERKEAGDIFDGEKQKNIFWKKSGKMLNIVRSKYILAKKLKMGQMQRVKVKAMKRSANFMEKIFQYNYGIQLVLMIRLGNLNYRC